MTIQQMMLGAYAPMKPQITGGDGTVFMPEPAPGSATVNASASVSVGNGEGLPPFSYSWEYVSGDTSIQPTSSTTNATCSWSAVLFKNTQVDAVWRVTVTDAIESVSVSVPVSLSYHTDI